VKKPHIIKKFWFGNPKGKISLRMFQPYVEYIAHLSTGMKWFRFVSSDGLPLTSFHSQGINGQLLKDAPALVG
jgi:hypothetical protein